MCQPCSIAGLEKNFFAVPHFPSCHLGASRLKGPDKSRVFTKRITWSDWKPCFCPDPLPTSRSQKHRQTARFGNCRATPRWTLLQQSLRAASWTMPPRPLHSHTPAPAPRPHG